MPRLDTYNKRDGISQRKRLVPALDASKLKIIEDDTAYWLRYIRDLAPLVVFFNDNNQFAGDWTSFFPISEQEIQDLLSEGTSAKKVKPHLALILAFLDMLKVAQTEMNGLVQKHLDYYYQEVLKIRPIGTIPDKVYITFELAKNAGSTQRLDEKTQLFAGKDTLGKDLIYQTNRELIVNRAKLKSIKTLAVDPNDGRIFMAPIADSADGQGAPLAEESPYWNTFGESQTGKSEITRTMLDAEIGFVFASPIFLLQEGTRIINLKLTFKTYRLNQGNIDYLRQNLNPVPSNDFIEKIDTIKDIVYPNEASFNATLQELLSPQDFNNYIRDILSEAYFPFRAFEKEAFENAFKIFVSTDEGWTPLTYKVTILKESNQEILQFLFDNIDGTFPSIIPLSKEEQTFSTSYPALRFLFDHEAPRYPYLALKDLIIDELNIEVDVKGVKNLVLANDNGLINPTVPFFPFGTIPTVGTKFYIGSPEIFQKKLEKLSFNLSWADLPSFAQGFETHYAATGYNVDDIQRNINNAFSANVEFLKDGEWVSNRENTINLFDYRLSTPGVPSGLVSDISRSSDSNHFILPDFGWESRLTDFQAYALELKRGFFRLNLQAPDFGHSVYPQIYTEALVNFAKLPVGTNEPLDAPNKPYTPKVTSFSIDYKSSIVVNSSADTSTPFQIFQAGPFGNRAVVDFKTSPLVSDYQNGTLYLGFENLVPSQNLSMLVQQLEGSGRTDIDLSKMNLEWSQLGNNQWRIIPNTDIIIDSTMKLNKTGIVELKIGRGITDDNQWLPKGLFWLRARTNSDISGINKTNNITTQAVEASFFDQENAPSHFENPLEKEKITKLVKRLKSIKKVTQPLPSMGGKTSEKPLLFAQRVSERLKHRQRAITTWDMERLVLNQFPEIFKVKCLKHTSPTSNHHPGTTTVLVIPDLKERQLSNPFEPKVSPSTRESIRQYLQAYAGIFTQIYVESPQFEPIRIEAKVAFKSGFDGIFYANQLNEALKKFLSPWAFEEGEEIVFGGRIYISRILAFMESLDYVDLVADFKLFHVNQGPGIGQMTIEDSFIVSHGNSGRAISFIDPSPGIGDMTIEENFVVRSDAATPGIGFAEASQIRSILVSAPNHHIEVLESRSAICKSDSIIEGIGAMYIEVNFIVQ